MARKSKKVQQAEAVQSVLSSVLITGPAQADPEITPNLNECNPFRAGTRAAWMFDAVCAGGIAGELATQSIQLFPVKPRHNDELSADPTVWVQHCFNEGLLRVNDALRTAKRQGLDISKEGKGAEAVVKITVS